MLQRDNFRQKKSAQENIPRGDAVSFRGGVSVLWKREQIMLGMKCGNEYDDENKASVRIYVITPPLLHCIINTIKVNISNKTVIKL